MPRGLEARLPPSMPGGEEEKALHPHILQRKRKERERKKEGNKERKKELTFSPLPPLQRSSTCAHTAEKGMVTG